MLSPDITLQIEQDITKKKNHLDSLYKKKENTKHVLSQYSFRSYMHLKFPHTDHIIISCQSSVTASVCLEIFKVVKTSPHSHKHAGPQNATKRSCMSLRKVSTKQSKHMKVTGEKYWYVTTITVYFHIFGYVTLQLLFTVQLFGGRTENVLFELLDTLLASESFYLFVRFCVKPITLNLQSNSLQNESNYFSNTNKQTNKLAFEMYWYTKI